MTKKDFYKKALKKCPCCPWPGAIHQMGRRKWLALKKNGYKDRIEIDND